MIIWRTDADGFKGGDRGLKIIFENNAVKNFLTDPKMLGVAATKGQGKTFLIKAKRNRLHNSTNPESDTTSVDCFPKDVSLVDTFSSTIDINKPLKGLLKHYYNWVTLWQFSIVATIVSSIQYRNLYKSNDFASFSQDVLTFFNRKINEKGDIVYEEYILNQKNRPSIIFSLLLKSDFSTLKCIIEETNRALYLLDRISNGVYFFIDKVDQAFSSLIYNSGTSRKQNSNHFYWQYIQYALADASYKLFTLNNHIKVYYTIRQEAIINSHELAQDISRNIESYLVQISYSKNDLFEMFRLYVENESDEYLFDSTFKYSDAEKAMFGFNTIEHAYFPETVEKTFDYLYRHSLRRPYDIIKLCRELYLKGLKTMDIKTFRRTVNDISYNTLLQYLTEVDPFIVFSKKEIDNLLKTLNTNIFDSDYMKFACESFNMRNEIDSKCSKDCLSCNNMHPFSSLYNIGLLGYLRTSSDNPEPYQYFLPIGDSKLKLDKHDLTRSELYFLHPSLCDETENLRESIRKKFFRSEYTIVGEGIEVDRDKVDKIKESLQNYKNKIDDDKIFVSSTIKDIKNYRDVVKTTLLDLYLFPVMSEEPEFPYGGNDVDSHDHCIDELLKCKQLVFLIGTEYGGIYCGNKYKNYAEAIKKESKGKINEPSISLVEFFVARKNKINYKIFVSKTVMKEKEDRSKGIKTANAVCDQRVFDIVNFVNHLQEGDNREGNWFLTFENEEHLDRLLRNQHFASNRNI
jgi:hypothetical protein